MAASTPQNQLFGRATSFEPNAIIRGAQLTLVGAYRALQNPKLFSGSHYRQALIAVATGIVIRILVAIPTLAVRIFLQFLSIFMDLHTVDWDDSVLRGLDFLEHRVLQLPFFLMTFVRHFSPALDNMFMESLEWVDQTYIKKHRSEDPDHLRALYFPNLDMYSVAPTPSERKAPMDAVKATAMIYGRKALISLVILALSYVPVIGRLVLPAASFYTFQTSVGLEPAAAIFVTGIFLPRRYLVTFLQSYYASRSLMRDLLEPYFKRVKFTPAQKKIWFHDRSGVLFGFAVGFFVILKIPLLGVLFYGIAEASTAYLLTKITDPPPPPAQWKEYAQNQAHWHNKHEFLKLPLDKLDAYNVTLKDRPSIKKDTELKGRQFS